MAKIIIMIIYSFTLLRSCNYFMFLPVHIENYSTFLAAQTVSKSFCHKHNLLQCHDKLRLSVWPSKTRLRADLQNVIWLNNCIFLCECCFMWLMETKTKIDMHNLIHFAALISRLMNTDTLGQKVMLAPQPLSFWQLEKGLINVAYYTFKGYRANLSSL